MANPISPARRAAWDVLTAFLVANPDTARLGSKNRPFPPPGLDDRDRALAKDLAEGVVRRRATLDAVLTQLTGGRKPRPEGVRAALLLGAYQILFDPNTPARAAVHEAVALARIVAKDGGAGFTNAVLRKLSARPELASWLSLPSSDDDAGAWVDYYSHCEALIARWRSQHGDDTARRLLEVGNARPHLGLRCNETKIGREELLARLAREGIAATPGQHPRNLIVTRDSDARRSTAVLETDSFREGLFSVQDATQTEVVDLLDLEPGQRVLDLCAAPGGKSTAIAEALGDDGTVLAYDRDPKRLDGLPGECARLGVGAVRVLGSREELEALASEPVDRVIVDAPCSNTGVLARRVEARFSFSEAKLTTLAEAQSQLIRQADQLLAPGGRLVYATCSIEPEENDQLVTRLAPELGLEVLSAERTLPELGVRDGGGVAVLIKPTHS